ncbi:DNA double-strand break repair nuclease NurA [Chloroflexota bacterium]
MSLDLTKVAAQVGGMVAQLKADGEARQKRLNYTLEVLHNQAGEIDALKRKIATAKTTWLVAGLVDGLQQHLTAPPCPDEFTVMATDGSNIDVDRHQQTRCYLINIGSVALYYGHRPGAFMESYPRLYSSAEEMVITPTGPGREQMIEGNLLGIKRATDECQQLAKLASEMGPGSSSLALVDGSLILWSLEAYPEFVIEALLNECFLRCLEEMRKLNQDRKLALASYISFPRGTDVVNALRVALCPHERPDCDRYCSAQERDCEGVAGIRDRDLFARILGEGERSALFTSESSIVQKRYGPHQVYFCYLRAGDEIARIEMPRWVATDEGLLNLTHSLVLDQCRRGLGYPVALSEAHERAVITGADRENFWQLVESLMIEEHMPSTYSAKSFSKRTRWV